LNYKKLLNPLLINCSFSLLAQRKRTSSEAAKEKAAYHLAFGFPPLLIKADASASRTPSGGLYPLAGYSAESFFCFLLRCSAA
jgi:hypothetical protein